MKSRNCSSGCRLSSVLLAVLALSPGCAILDRDATNIAKLPELSSEAAQQPAQQSAQQLASPQPAGSVTMEVRPAGNKTEVRQLALTPSMHIQDALEQADLPGRFKRMDLHVMRVSGDQRHKLDSKYGHKSGTVNPLYDYSLRPGDHIVVIEDTRNIFDDMLESFGGPMRTMTR